MGKEKIKFENRRNLENEPCTEDQKLQLNLQKSMINTVRNSLLLSLTSIKDKLKTKYFFGTVINLLKFLSDRE